MAATGGASSISVTVRVRPFTIREAAQLTKCDDGPLFLGEGSLAGISTPKLQQKGIRSVIKVVDDKCLVFDPPEDNPVHRFSKSVVPNGKRVKDQTFMFDRVFDENTTQGEVYEATTRNLLDSVLDGYNATVFAYGATGCGKTHTITGTTQQPGIIFLTMQELFERIAERSGEKVTEVSLSYLEIYNETIRDLLVPATTKGGLMLREDANQSVSVAGLSSHYPQNVQEVMDIIMRGNECRTMSPTDANATSSRSHAVLQINVAQKDRNASINEPHTMATLSIIDLAGSERASATKNRGERLIEGANINKSLLALGSCINALCDPRKRNHVPYRNSKLTRLLKFSLGGNCKTVMIVCITKTLAFAKFKKQAEKKDGIVQEGISRLRSAYEHAAPEREEKVNNKLRLRQVSRRITLLSSWIAAFDGVCDSRGCKGGLGNLQAIRKTAQGILLELEGSRQHYHQRLAKCNWERGLNSALENGIKQLREVDASDHMDVENLKREAELLKARAERDALSAVSEQEKTGDMETVQMLLQANFETIAAIEDITQLSENEAIEIGKHILGKLLQTCTTTTSQVVKPDGSPIRLAPVSTPKLGSPKKRKKFSLGGTAALPRPVRLSLVSGTSQSPAKNSPRRRKAAAPKKAVAFTPKKAPKPSKRSVRWKDDVEDGALAEFEKTPRKHQASPEAPSSCEPTLPPAPTMASSIPLPTSGGSRESSPAPAPAPPELNAIHVKNSSRFKTGFLSKRPSGSPTPVPPTLTKLPSSDSESSPLRQIENSNFLNRQSLDRSSGHSSENEENWKIDKLEAMQITTAMRRISGSYAGNLRSGTAITRIRRRSQSPTSASSSPINSENTMFTASQARRMVKSEKDHDLRVNVLSPRTLPVMKNPGQRRVTSAEIKPREAAIAGRENVRFSATAISSGGSLRASPRGSASGTYR
ncbi:kinesin-2 subunit [Coccidioides immitis RMSCC 3703]|uniref:Kinesin-like protein n=1 Tax=Coccidioides immitis RMSCC 3703 TaxID=454286 RepID=A0A0J8QZI1_COCIT|nr:kinesin-2 subunit [Coccidioides immitis RMSCC 3703]